MAPRRHPHPVIRTLGFALRQARWNVDLSQEALQDVTGVHRNYIGGIERGERNPSIAVIAVLAEAVGVSMHELFEDAEARLDAPGERSLLNISVPR